MRERRPRRLNPSPLVRFHIQESFHQIGAVDFFVRQRHGQQLAAEYRPDLRAAGLGSGCHAFSLPLPHGAVRGLDIRRVSDGAALCLPDAIRAV